MREETIKSVKDYVDHVDIFDLLTETVIFRGQARQGNLLPGVARKDASNDTSRSEKTVLQQLKLMGATFLEKYETSLLDVLVIAQHYGLKTRLLDWTSNPLVALWFACSDPAKGDAYVYALDAYELLKEDLYARDPFSFQKTYVFQPKLNNPMIVAQEGWFTLHCYSTESKRFVPLEHNAELKNRLTQFCIPEAERPEILGTLGRLGVSHKTLFPGLKGICEHLNWAKRLGTGT